MEKIVKIPENVSNEIEKAQYEYNCSKDLLNYLLQNNSSSSIIDKYYHNCIECYEKYEKVKAMMQTEYLQPAIEGNMLNWNLDFVTHEVIVSYE